MDILPFVSLMKEIEFILKLQGDTPMVLCSILENTVTYYKDNQGYIALAVYQQMKPHTNHTMIKYYKLRSFFANGDVQINYVDTK